MIDVVTILTLVEKIAFIDAFVMHVFAEDTFWKHEVNIIDY